MSIDKRQINKLKDGFHKHAFWAVRFYICGCQKGSVLGVGFLRFEIEELLHQSDLGGDGVKRKLGDKVHVNINPELEHIKLLNLKKNN